MLILDPTGDLPTRPTALAPGVDTLAGRTVCLLDISKPKGVHFLDEIERRLVSDHGVARVVRRVKPTFSRPAPSDLVESIAGEVDLVIEALAD